MIDSRHICTPTCMNEWMDMKRGWKRREKEPHGGAGVVAPRSEIGKDEPTVAKSHNGISLSNLLSIISLKSSP